MPDDSAFERQIGVVLGRMGGPEPTVDAMAITRTAATPPSRWRFQPMVSAVRFVVAGAIVAVFGGFLIGGVLTQQPTDDSAPGVGASAPIGTPVPPSPLAVASAAPVAVLPVDWVFFDDAAVFRGGGHSGGDVLEDVAVAPDGEAVIVGSGRHCESFTWTSASGGDWQRSALSDTPGALPSRVLATTEGFVAIGERPARCQEGSGPAAYVWTSRDGIDWSEVSFDGAVFGDLDSVDDTVVILGTQRNKPTVWTSRSGGPWEVATISEGDPSFSPDQLALSADGIYLVRDRDTGLLYRSQDGLRFTSVDMPDGLQAGDEGRFISSLVRVADGFALVAGSVTERSDDLSVISVSTWLSPDGLDWRRGDVAPGLTTGGVQLGTQGAAAVMWRDRAGLEDYDAARAHLGFLQADGTWCAVAAPSEASALEYGARMAWNEDGRSVVVRGGVVRIPGVWSADGVRCER